MASLHTKYFEEALRLAERAGRSNEVPIGAVLVQEGKILARAHNLTEKKRNFLAHAEILCLTIASQKLKSKFISNATLYVTVEPCMMCRFAARLCRIESIYYLAPSQKFGRNSKRYFHTKIRRARSSTQTDSAIMHLKNFFQIKRSTKID